MKSWKKLVAALYIFIPSTSAQITGGGGSFYDQTASIPELLGQLFGVSVRNPYELLGVLATFAVMWVSTYIIFKVAIRYLDDNFEDGRMNRPFQDAMGLTNEDDRNILAVLTLLITLTIVGSAGFAGLINGWQALILLAFTFMLLAGIIFVLIGGVGGIIGGSAYVTGASAKATARGAEQMAEGIQETKEALSRAEVMEERIEEEEAREEEEIEAGDEDQADREAEQTAEELEQVIRILSDAEEELNELMEEEVEELENDIERIRTVINLLGENDG